MNFLRALFAFVSALLLGGCSATQKLINSDEVTAYKSKYTTIDDEIVASAYSSNDGKLVLLGANYAYAIDQSTHTSELGRYGLERLVALIDSGTLDPTRLQVASTHTSISALEPKDGTLDIAYDAKRQQFYLELKFSYTPTTQQEREWLTAQKWDKIQGKAEYFFNLVATGKLYQNSQNRVNSSDLARRYPVRIVVDRSQIEYVGSSARLALLPVALAADVVIVPLQTLFLGTWMAVERPKIGF